MSTININGRSYSGRNITINNNRVVIDGADVTPDQKDISIHVEGDIESITADACNKVTVAGDVTGSVKTMSGDVEIGGNIEGSISTMSGDVECQDVGGSISSMSGSIKHRKK